jgi:hypothetical protein
MQFKINIDKALAAAERNLKDHISELTEATSVWTEKVHIALDELKNSVDREGLKVSYNNLQHLMYQKPVDNRAQYSQYIGALTLAKENGDVIEMDEAEYDHIFNDNWDWRVASKTSNAAYSVKRH